MAICKKCGKTYLSKECPHCKNLEIKDLVINEKDKLFKTIRYAIIIFIGIFVTGIIIDIIMTTYFIKAVSPEVKMINEATKDMIKAQKEAMKTINKGFKIPNLYKKQ